MSSKKIFLKSLAVLACLLMLSAHTVSSQDICEGDLNYDRNVDAYDNVIFNEDYGRNIYNDPCPLRGPAPVPKTGQIDMFTYGDDGYWQYGITWPTPRFTNNYDGTVTDNLTGLMWTQNGQIISGIKTWTQALTACNNLIIGAYSDWRLPNIKELLSLIRYEYIETWPPAPALPPHPFSNVLPEHYWTSTTNGGYTDYAFVVDLYFGTTFDTYKGYNGYYVWPVRGGR